MYFEKMVIRKPNQNIYIKPITNYKIDGRSQQSNNPTLREKHMYDREQTIQVARNKRISHYYAD